MNGQELICLSVSDRSASMEVRERLALGSDAQGLLLRSLNESGGEYVLLTTCRRTEFYCWKGFGGIDGCFERIEEATGVHPQTLRVNSAAYGDDRCAWHLMRVAAGLESPVPGEPHVQGQVRRAFLHAQELGAAGPVLSALFRGAIHVGRRVRRDTSLGQSASSYGIQAIDWVERACGPMSDRSVVVVGGGRMAREVVWHLRRVRAERVTIINRDPMRVEGMGRWIGARVAGFDQLSTVMVEADAAIVCTSAPEYVMTANLLGDRSRRSLFLVDMAMPRNIDPMVAGLPGVHLVHLETLAPNQGALNHNVETAHRLIAREVDRFRQWLVARGRVACILSTIQRAAIGRPSTRSVRRRRAHETIMRLKRGWAA